MTKSQISLIKKTGEAYTANPQQTGAILLYNYFKDYPNVREYFPKFKEIPLESLKEDPQFKEFGMKIVKVGEKVINSLDLENPWSYVEEVADQCLSHSIKDKQYYVDFRKTIEKRLNMKGDSKAAWDVFLDNFFYHFFSKF